MAMCQRRIPWRSGPKRLVCGAQRQFEWTEVHNPPAATRMNLLAPPETHGIEQPLFAWTTMLPQPIAASSVPAQFSTDAYAPRERVAAWCDLFGSTIAKLEMEPLCEGELKADATLRKFTGFGLVTM